MVTSIFKEYPVVWMHVNNVRRGTTSLQEALTLITRYTLQRQSIECLKEAVKAIATVPCPEKDPIRKLAYEYGIDLTEQEYLIATWAFKANESPGVWVKTLASIRENDPDIKGIKELTHLLFLLEDPMKWLDMQNYFKSNNQDHLNSFIGTEFKSTSEISQVVTRHIKILKNVPCPETDTVLRWFFTNGRLPHKAHELNFARALFEANPPEDLKQALLTFLTALEIEEEN